MINLGFTGTRKGCSNEQFNKIKIFLYNTYFETFLQGCCIGADEQITEEVYKLGKFIQGFPPKNKTYLSKRAMKLSTSLKPPERYLRRDRLIVDSSDLLLSAPFSTIPDNSGSWYTINYAKESRIPVVLINKDGMLEWM